MPISLRVYVDGEDILASIVNANFTLVKNFVEGLETSLSTTIKQSGGTLAGLMSVSSTGVIDGLSDAISAKSPTTLKQVQTMFDNKWAVGDYKMTSVSNTSYLNVNGEEWISPDGRLLSRTAYPTLFTKIGTQYGAGDGYTTFAVPNISQKSPMCMGNQIGLSPRVLGEIGGTESVRLGTDEIPSHNHAVDDNGHAHQVSADTHTHTLNKGSVVGGSAVRADAITNGTFQVSLEVTGESIATNKTGITLETTGGGESHENLHPFAVVNIIYRIK